MSDFYTVRVNSGIKTSKRDAIQKNGRDLSVTLEILEGEIKQIKNLIVNDCYYTSIIDEIVAVRSELNSVAYILLEENIKACLAERIQGENPEVLERLFITTGRVLK